MNKCWHLLFFLLFSFYLKGQDLYKVNRIQEFKIYIADEYWDNKLNAYKKQGREDRLIAKLIHNGVTYDSVGIRYKGNSSYFNTRKENATKLPLNIKINHIKAGQYLPGDYKRIKLSNVFRDPSFLREVLSYEIIGQYMPASRSNFAKVYINDEYIGFYNSTEAVDSKFIRKRFSTNNGTLFKCDPIWKAKPIPNCPPSEKSNLVYLGKDSTCYQNSYELKSLYGWEGFIQLVDILNNQTDKIESILNVDQILWMHALNHVLVNLDSYTGRLCHNYYLYQDSVGIFHPIIWDLNMSFGGFRFDGSGKALSNEDLQNFSLFTHYKNKNPERPLINLLLQNDLYRKIYLAHVQTILNNHFKNGQYKDRAKKLQAIIDLEVQKDENKLYPYEAFQQNIDKSTMANTAKIIGLTELMDKRTEYLSKHPVFQKTSPTITAVKHKEVANGVNITAKIQGNKDGEGNLLKVYLAYRNQKTGTFQRVEMVDDGGQHDGAVNDQIYGKTIEKASNTIYYIIAEGERVATLSPEKASFEFYKVE